MKHSEKGMVNSRVYFGLPKTKWAKLEKKNFLMELVDYISEKVIPIKYLVSTNSR